MNTVSPKVVAGFGGAGGTTPFSIVIIWLIGLTGVTLPPEVAGALAAMIAALGSLLAGYVVPHQGAAPSPPTTA